MRQCDNRRHTSSYADLEIRKKEFYHCVFYVKYTLDELTPLMLEILMYNLIASSKCKLLEYMST